MIIRASFKLLKCSSLDYHYKDPSLIKIGFKWLHKQPIEMQRQILHGVPYYVDSSSKLYTYTDEPIHIGSVSGDGAVTIRNGAYESLDAGLAEWRSKQSARSRKPQEVKKNS